MLEDTAWPALSCRGCLGASCWAWCTWLTAHKKCAVVHISELCCQVEELLEEVSRRCVALEMA